MPRSYRALGAMAMFFSGFSRKQAAGRVFSPRVLSKRSPALAAEAGCAPIPITRSPDHPIAAITRFLLVPCQHDFGLKQCSGYTFGDGQQFALPDKDAHGE